MLASGMVAGAAAVPRRTRAAERTVYKAAVIGRTGGGDYGHGLDTIFNGLDNVNVVAVSDRDPEGGERAASRNGAERVYTDYREMLDKEKPDLVSIAPRQPDCHKDMALAAIGAGAHIYMEKPISETPAEADAMLAAASARGVKIAVAHTKRFMDHFLLMKKLIDDGYLGEILHVSFQGKQDARAGGEDLIVLGSHDMDMMRFFFGDPQWCFASVTADGQPIGPDDARMGNEPYLLAGDTVRAQYRFANGVHCHWRSVTANGGWNRNYEHGGRTISKWGFDIHGSMRILSHQESVGTFILDFPFIAPGDDSVRWRPLEEAGSIVKPERLGHPVRDLIFAIERDVEPQCSGEDARWAVEMVCAAYRSQRAGAPVAFPLEERGHPLEDWRPGAAG